MKKRISQKMLLAFLGRVAYQANSRIPGGGRVYLCVADGAYIAQVGNESKGIVKTLLKRGITEQLQGASGGGGTISLGYCPSELKWYGWSHRAMFGFSPGSTCKKGNCHYVPTSPEEIIEDHGVFFSDISEECAQSHKDRCTILPDRTGVLVKSAGYEGHIIACGKGEWTAMNMQDAKQMAIDFARSVS